MILALLPLEIGHALFQDAEPAIVVETPGPDGYAASVALVGEHDLATAPELAEALRETAGPVLVDLSQCTFIDSTVIGALVRAHRGLQAHGHRLDVRAAEGTQVRRALDVAGVATVLRVV
jgi:anti-sigma B factor antagonist